MEKGGYVYILASNSRVIYIGVTRSLVKRLHEYREGLTPGFATKYKTSRLVYFEAYPDIAREKQLKGWSRKKKVALIEGKNRFWEDLTHTILTG